MFKKRIAFILISCVLLIFGSYPAPDVAASSDSIRVDDDVTVEKYYWQDTWDANQNNAYIDIVSGFYNVQTEIDLHDDYINSEQLMNVVKRISQD